MCILQDSQLKPASPKAVKKKKKTRKQLLLSQLFCFLFSFLWAIPVLVENPVKTKEMSKERL